MSKNLSCNVHASSFVKGETDEYGDVKNLKSAIGITGDFDFKYTYPLSVEARFTHTLSQEMTGEDILSLARSDYERIYKEEDTAAGDPGHIPGMLNRSRSEGPYGIWGHDFSDLYFEGICISLKKKTIEFAMGS